MANQAPIEPSQPPPWQIVADGAVCVYRFALDLPEAEIQRLLGLLDAGEQARAERFAFDHLRRRFIAAHGQMRLALAAFLPEETPNGLRFAANRYGKPSLTGRNLHFNLSHSGDLALLAVSESHEVGIDVETVRPEVDRGVIAARFFAPAEAEALKRLAPVQQVEAFYACWTRKEAYIKARGLGLQIPLDRFAVSLPPDDPPRLVIAEPGIAQHFTFYALDPGAGFAATLCVVT